ncbi:thioesterase domain-containing protein [Streptomyces sp. E5N91]|uniref:thioesterase II family protein n=1 Tax=Streptomyces sp. E5N91 TaxID=1851996 RepID=UPI001EE917D5|nr:thioesterase domain-containing protein [Streptomyces sp. E5N91]
MIADTATTSARTGAPAAALRLFCFHHAGGQGTAFLGWQKRLGARAEVIPVRLPPPEDVSAETADGRGMSMTLVVASLDHELGPMLRRPFLFYGHSMGALVAYHLTRLRQSRGRPLPERLLIGAYPAPHLPHRLAHCTHLPDEDLLALLPPHPAGHSRLLRQAPGLATATAARLRLHLGLCDSAAPAAPNPAQHTGHGSPQGRSEPLRCPVDVFTGISDPLVTDAEAAAWRHHTRAGCRIHRIPGGHFFTRETPESRAAFFDRLCTVLAGPSEWAAGASGPLPVTVAS